MKTYDLIAIGELLIDFAQLKTTADPIGSFQAEQYEANPGGAPANVVAAAQAFGCRTAFIGAVGTDHFGDTILSLLNDTGMSTEGVVRTNDAFTTLAFVSIDEHANRTFSFARKPGADTRLRLEAHHLAMLADTACLHFGTITLTDDPARTATKQAVEYAAQSGSLISFDPNARLNLWDDRALFSEQFEWGVAHCDFMKLSEEDIAALGRHDPDRFVRDALQRHQVALVALTLGKSGCRLYVKRRSANRIESMAVPAFLTDASIDTTGAGDIFTGSFMSRLLPAWRDADLPLIEYLDTADMDTLYEAARFANRVASLSTTKLGGIPSIPTKEMYERHIRASNDA